MRAVAIPMADRQLEFHWLPDPGFPIQGFLIQGPRRIRALLIATARFPSRFRSGRTLGQAQGAIFHPRFEDRDSRCELFFVAVCGRRRRRRR